MKRLWSFSVVMAFLLFPLGFLFLTKIELQRTDRERQISLLREELQLQLKQLDHLCFAGLDLTTYLNRVDRMAAEISGKDAAARLLRHFDKHVRSLLPNTQLLIFRIPPAGQSEKHFEILYQGEDRLGFSTVLPTFFRGLNLRSRPDWKTLPDEIWPQFNQEIYKNTGIPVLITELFRNRGVTRFSQFLDKAYAFQWGKTKSDLGYFLIVDKHDLRGSAKWKILAKLWMTTRFGLAILPRLMDSNPAFSPWFQKNRDLCHFVANLPFNSDTEFRFFQRGDSIFAALPVRQHDDFRLIAIGSLNSEAKEMEPFTLIMALSLTLVIFGGGAAFRRLILQRESLDLALTPILLAGFTLSALLPLAATYRETETLLLELAASEAGRLEQDLHQSLQDIDDMFGVEQASLTTNLTDTLSRRDIQAKMTRVWREETRDGDFAQFALRLSQLVQECFPGVLSRIYITQDALAQGFFKDRVDEEPRKWKRIPHSGVEWIFQKTAGYQIRLLNETWGFSPPRLAFSKPQPVGKSQGFKQDFMFEWLGKVFGENCLFSMIHFPDDSGGFLSLYGQNPVISLPLKFDNAYRIFAILFWPDIFQETLVAPLLYSSDSPVTRKQGRFFSVFGYRGIKNVYPGGVKKGDAEFPTLMEMSRTTLFQLQPQKFKDEGRKERPIMETRPAENSSGLIAGWVPTDKLEKNRLERRKLGQLFIAICFGISLGIALIGAASILAPLRRLTLGVGAIEHGDFSHRLDAGRPDEFGALAQTFNMLGQGLAEGKILARYVSGSVRKAILGNSSDHIPKANQSTDVTIVFCGIHDFDTRQKSLDTEEIFSLLRFQMEVFNKALKETRGEIDKLISDRVMVVFRHDDYDSPQEIGRDLLHVIGEVQKAFSSHPAGIQPVMGINSGHVISGILGAQKVRLEHTVIGDAVNLAARLATLAAITEGTRTVLSAQTCALLPPATPLMKLPFKSVKGKTQQVEAFLLQTSHLEKCT